MMSGVEAQRQRGRAAVLGSTTPPSTENSVWGQVRGNVVQAGHIERVDLRTSAPVRSRYHLQVHRIAPRTLIGRSAELDELTVFCTSPEPFASYWWWRADAWSGKSALMSWFALHPPAGVRVVSFFVTARLHGQNDRSAFIDNVMEQLLALLGGDVPQFLGESTRDAHLLGRRRAT